MITVFYLDDAYTVLGSSSEVIRCIMDEAAYTLTLAVPLEVYARYNVAGGFVALTTLDNAVELFRVQKAVTSEPEGTVELYAESIGYDLAFAPFIRDRRPDGLPAAAALAVILEGTGWQPGVVTAANSASTTWYDLSPLEALNDLAEKWSVRYSFRVEISGNVVTAKYVDIRPVTPVWRGKRYRLGKDVSNLKYTIDNRELVTALYGRGKGEPTGDGYGRRITFADVVWSHAAGDPADKPAGQDYVADPEAAALYGSRYALVTFGAVEDPGELLRQTWEALQRRCRPALSCAATVVDLERMGYPHEAARVGDQCLIIIDEVDIETLATVQDIKRDYLNPASTRVIFGETPGTLTTRVAAGSKTWDKAAAINPTGTVDTSIFSGAIDVAKTQLRSSVTNYYTDDTGASVWVADDGQSAIRITGNGFQIADHKVGEDWDWTTAATGSGVVAEQIIGGTIRADVAFAGTLISASGTFGRLVAGLESAQRLELGTDESGDPFMRVYDNEGNLALTLIKTGIQFANQTNFTAYSVGTKTGIGIYAGG